MSATMLAASQAHLAEQNWEPQPVTFTVEAVLAGAEFYAMSLLFGMGGWWILPGVILGFFGLTALGFALSALFNFV